ncbi:MAG: tyrosine--tRNA ligase [Lentisphaerae bacterium]|nr:tyrosine--tRNA ligase [Lentisphaerota bacterium]
MESVLDILKQRGLFDAVTSEELARTLREPVTLYAGFDPSAPSLGVGNMVTLMVLSHFQRCGHRVVALVGGATGMIGDPSGKSAERQLLGREDIDRNVRGITGNISRFLDFEHPSAPARLVNNEEWLGRFTFIEFLRDVGKHFRMGAMLSRDSVRARLDSEGGMSFTEFSYALLQAYDFLHLHDTCGCVLQVGGSDQWGNITAGTDLVRRLRGREVFGLTFPLLTDSAGQKFGKSEGNSVYLDAGMTSCYAFYQFFLRAADSDVDRLLRVFTFLPENELAALAEQTRTAPEKREAQRTLAEEVTRMAHGRAGLEKARRASEVLFGGPVAGIAADDALEIFAHVPSTEAARGGFVGRPVAEVAAESGLCQSKSAARRLAQSGGLYAGDRRVSQEDTVLEGDLLDGRLLVLRSGKKTFRLVKLV